MCQGHDLDDLLDLHLPKHFRSYWHDFNSDRYHELRLNYW